MMLSIKSQCDEKVLSKEEAEANTSVWWDMDTFPVPSGYDAGRIGECIKDELKKLGYSGPVTISGYGDLQQTPEHVLRALSSTGITLNHTYHVSLNLNGELRDWKHVNPAPATIMLIRLRADVFNEFRIISDGKVKGYNMVVKTNWKKLIEGATTTVSESSTSSVSTDDQSAPCFCTLCYLTPAQSVESFIKHRSSEEHVERLEEFQRILIVQENLRVAQIKAYHEASLDSHPETPTTTTSLVMEQPKKKLKTMNKCKTIPPPQTLVEANKLKKKLKKKKKKKSMKQSSGSSLLTNDEKGRMINELIRGSNNIGASYQSSKEWFRSLPKETC